MVKQLMSFGDHMIGTIYREWLDNPEAIKDFDAFLRKRETTLADLQRWHEKNPTCTFRKNRRKKAQLNSLVKSEGPAIEMQGFFVPSQIAVK